MDFSLLALEIFTGVFVAFVVLSFVAILRAWSERTRDLAEGGEFSSRPIRRCYECLDAATRDARSTIECSSACGELV